VHPWQGIYQKAQFGSAVFHHFGLYEEAHFMAQFEWSQLLIIRTFSFWTESLESFRCYDICAEMSHSDGRKPLNRQRTVWHTYLYGYLYQPIHQGRRRAGSPPPRAGPPCCSLQGLTV
jgi:hypothetical protein